MKVGITSSSKLKHAIKNGYPIVFRLNDRVTAKLFTNSEVAVLWITEEGEKVFNKNKPIKAKKSGEVSI